jgi:hypothetical protein
MESQNRARDKIKYPILDQFGDIAAKMRTPKGDYFPVLHARDFLSFNLHTNENVI